MLVGRGKQEFTDPFQFRRHLARKRILYSAGSNDPLFPVAIDSVFLPRMPDSICVLLVPNGSHRFDTDRNRTARNMWLAHCFAGRDIPRLMITTRCESGHVNIAVNIASSTEVRVVRC